MHYAWAFRHAGCVDRVLGIFPVTDIRTWPGIDKIIGPGAVSPPGIGYGLSREDFEKRIQEFNPIDILKPLAASGVKIVHLHGDKDYGVPSGPNSEVFAERYRAFGG